MNIFVQDESKNIYGTWKDRRSKYIIQKALNEGVQKLSLITSGNAGYSLAMHARPHGIQVVCIVDQKLKDGVKNKLREVCHVIEVELGTKILKPEEVIALVRMNEHESVWDVTNGYSESYVSIISELPRPHPDFLICPVGSGEAFVGLYQAIKENHLHTKLIGVGVEECSSFADKLSTPWTPYANKISEILTEGHQLLRLSEKQVKTTYEKYTGSYKSEPSAVVVWAALEFVDISSSSNIVIVNSGEGLW